jgi:uncharacterized protein YdaU (DUF1376 family)
MNKPDSYMPMYWLDFWPAVEGYEDYIAIGYLRLLSHYWHITHCSGLKHDIPFLQRLSRILDEKKWDIAEPILFDGINFFELDHETNTWHQKRALSEWQSKVASYNSVMARAKAGGQATKRKYANT